MGAECTRFCKNNIGGGVFHIERCWGVFATYAVYPGHENLHGVGGYVVEKVFGVVYTANYQGTRECRERGELDFLL